VTGTAYETPATRRWLRRYALRGLLPLVGGIVVLTVMGALIDPDGATHGTANVLVPLGSGLALVLLGTAVCVWAGAARMGRLLRREPWTPYACRYRNVGGKQPVLVLEGVGGRHVLTVLALIWRWRTLDACDGRTVWFVGDPDRGGVVAPPDGAPLLLVRRPRSKLVRERLGQAAG
jgi:hypothetical protein